MNKKKHFIRIIEYGKNIPELNIILALFCFSTGIIFMDFAPLWLSIVFSVICLCISVFLKKKKLIILTIIFAMGGFLYFSYRLIPSNHIARNDIKNIQYTEGIISSQIEKHANSYIFYLKPNIIKTKNNKIKKVSGKIIVYLKCNATINQGDYIRISSYFYKPQTDDIYSSFDYENYLNRKNIYVATSIKKQEDIEVLHKQNSPLVIQQIQNYIINIYKKYLNPQSADLLMGMVLGNGNYLDAATYNNFINTSTLHLLAASGLNCFVLSIVVWYLFSFIEFRKKNIITICILWFYSALINFPASILRASLMCSLVLAGESLKKFTSYKIILFLSAFIILLINPSYIFDVGFQLSYLCLFAILYVISPTYKLTFEYLNRKFYKNKSTKFISLYIVNPLFTSIISGVGIYLSVTPLSLYYFKYISITGIFANLLVGSLASFIFIISVLFLIFWFIPGIKQIFIFAINVTSYVILYIVNNLGNISFSAISFKKANILFPLIFYIFFLVFFIFIYNILIKNSIENIKKKYKLPGEDKNV